METVEKSTLGTLQMQIDSFPSVFRGSFIRGVLYYDIAPQCGRTSQDGPPTMADGKRVRFRYLFGIGINDSG